MPRPFPRLLFWPVLLLGAALFAQQGDWTVLPNAPVTSRHNDVWFISPDEGWVVNGNGEIHHTGDGGNTWTLQFQKLDAHFRSVGFLNDSNGWAGNVGAGEFGTTDPVPLYHTADGGINWDPFTTFTGPTPAGICGMNVVDDSTIVAVGRVRGPAFFVRTTDGGATWTSRDMSAHAAGLIDVKFFHPDTGFAVGLTNSDHSQSSGVVLYTEDGGQTWVPRYTSPRTGEWCWKLTFPTRQVGYASLQRNSNTPIYFLKTLDGGRTWASKQFRATYYFVQGLGFVDELNGWIGGNSSEPVYETTDGGETWQSAGFGTRVNRLRFLGDTLGYAVGQTVYKYTRTVTGVGEAGNRGTGEPETFVLAQNYPNPFNPTTRIEFGLDRAEWVTLAVYNVRGGRIATLVDGPRAAGRYPVEWNGTDEAGGPVASGIYFYRMTAGDQVRTRKMMLLK